MEKKETASAAPNAHTPLEAVKPLTPKELMAVELLAMAPRSGMTDKEIRERMGLKYGAWRRLKDKPHIREAVYNRAFSMIKDEAPAVMKALVTKAKSGDVRAIELYLKHTGRYIEKSQRENIDKQIVVQIGEYGPQQQAPDSEGDLAAGYVALVEDVSD